MPIDIDNSHYNTGTATVVGTAVTGQGTAWEGAVRAGDLYGTHKGSGVRILSVDSNTALTLAYDVPALAQTAAPYEIQFTPYDVGYQASVRELLLIMASGNVEALASLALAPDKLLYADGIASLALTDFTALARDIVGAADEAAVRQIIGAGAGDLEGPDIITFNEDNLAVFADATGKLVKDGGPGVREIDRREYLWAYHKKVRAREAALITLSGDSTFANAPPGGPTPAILLSALASDFKVYNQTVFNAGHSGASIVDWDNTYVSVDAATHPHLYVPRWGITPGSSLTLPVFKTHLRSGLTKFRDECDFDTSSGLLMMPNTIGEAGTGRDVNWLLDIRATVREAAYDFKFLFFDTFELWRDAATGRGRYLDTPATIHPDAVFNAWIMGELAKTIWPPGVILGASTRGPIPVQVSPGAGFTLGGSPNGGRVTRNGNTCTLAGVLDLAPAAVLPSLAQVCYLPAGFLPNGDYQALTLVGYHTGTMFSEVIPAQVLANGTIRPLKASSQAITTVYVAGSFIGA
jgi:hypothetical protein